MQFTNDRWNLLQQVYGRHAREVKSWTRVGLLEITRLATAQVFSISQPYSRDLNDPSRWLVSREFVDRSIRAYDAGKQD